jgi:ribA/ribD-fused uncharacterized protein
MAERFQFYSGSRNMSAGAGVGEWTANPEEYFELNRIDNWRRMLSNFWIAPFEWRGKRWNTVEHAFQAAKFMDNHMDIAEQFTLDSGTELGCSDGLTARKRRKAVVLSTEELQLWDSKKGPIMKELWRAKFSAHPELLQVLKWTGAAELWHYIGRGGGVERWFGLEELRTEL